MFAVTHEYNGYRIKLYKIRSRIIAKNPAEIGIAAEHYFGSGCYGEKKNENCPICRHLMQREKKEKKS